MKKGNSKILLLLALLVIFVVVFFLKRREYGVRKIETIRVGEILPLTGKAAGVGQPAKEGLQNAQNYINEKLLSSTSSKIEFIIEDGEGSVAKSLNALNKLTINDGCDIIFSIISQVDLSILPIQAQKQFLFFSHASHPALSGVNGKVFRHAQTVEQEFLLIDANIKSEWDKTAYIYVNDDYGVAFKKLIETKTKSVSEYGINPNDIVNKSSIEKVLERKPTYIILNGNAPSLNPVIKTLIEKDYTGEIFTCLGFAATGGLSQNFPGISLSCVDFALDYNKDEEFIFSEDIFGKDVGTNQIIFFNSALLIGDAIKNGYITTDSIAQYIGSLNTFSGLSESMVIDAKNDILPPIAINKKN